MFKYPHADQHNIII